MVALEHPKNYNGYTVTFYQNTGSKCERQILRISVPFPGLSVKPSYYWSNFDNPALQTDTRLKPDKMNRQVVFLDRPNHCRADAITHLSRFRIHNGPRSFVGDAGKPGISVLNAAGHRRYSAPDAEKRA